MFKAIYLIIAVIYTIFLILVFKRDLKLQINRYFLYFLAGLLLWHLTLYLYLFVNVGNWLLFVGRLNYAAGPLFLIGLLGFFYYFPAENFKLPRLKNGFLIYNFILTVITLFTPLIDANETMTEAGPVVTLGKGYYLYLIFVLLLPLLTLILGAIKLFTLKGLDKLRFQYSFWIFVPTIIAFVLTNALLPIFGIIDQFIWSPLFLVPIVASSFYAIAKYRFLDIRFLLLRAVSFLIFIALCSTLYGAFIFFAIPKLFGFDIHVQNAIFGLILVVFATLSFQPALNWLHKITSHIFYKGRYDYEKLFADLTKIMSMSIDLAVLTKSVLAFLAKEIGLGKVGFLMITEEKVSDSFAIGFNKKDLKKKELILFITKYVFEKEIIFEELPENEHKKLLREHDIAILMPIKVKNNVVAVLVLGPKLSGEIYSIQDINFLDTFASEAGIAIQNAQSYEEIKKFNAVLEKRVEERTYELKKSQESELAKARDIAKLKDEFVFIASHELRTPVTAIKGFLDLARKGTKGLPKDIQEDLSYMSEASDHLSQLVNDLLEISRSESGAMQVSVAPTDIIPIIESIIREVQPEADKHRIAIHSKFTAKNTTVMVDEKKMKEVIMNLLSNAIKYNRDEGSVDITVFPVDDQLMIEVKDTGYGIPADQQDRIFTKFFRASNERTGEVLGTGLGLFLTRMLVEKMGGKITFTSIDKKGSTFAILVQQATMPLLQKK